MPLPASANFLIEEHPSALRSPCLFFLKSIRPHSFLHSPYHQLSSWVRNTSEQRMSTLLLTTASVLALPTLTEPPSTV